MPQCQAKRKEKKTGFGMVGVPGTIFVQRKETRVDPYICVQPQRRVWRAMTQGDSGTVGQGIFFHLCSNV